MRKTTYLGRNIRVSERTHKKLFILKGELRTDSFDKIINSALNNYKGDRRKRKKKKDFFNTSLLKDLGF